VEEPSLICLWALIVWDDTTSLPFSTPGWAVFLIRWLLLLIFRRWHPTAYFDNRQSACSEWFNYFNGFGTRQDICQIFHSFAADVVLRIPRFCVNFKFLHLEIFHFLYVIISNKQIKIHVACQWIHHIRIRRLRRIWRIIREKRRNLREYKHKKKFEKK
jgi:hypothetical protein